MHETLSESTLDVTSASSPVHLSGTITARDEGILLLSIPYDKGWRIRVDGQEEETFILGEALTGIHLEGGFHTLTLDYRPQGFLPGVIVSIVSLLLLLAGIFTGLLKGKSAAETASDPDGRYLADAGSWQ